MSSVTYTKDSTLFEFTYTATGWAVTCEIASIKFAANKVDFFPIPGAPTVDQLKELFKFPSTVAFNGADLALTFDVKLLGEDGLVVTLTRDPKVRPEEALPKMLLYITALEKKLLRHNTSYVPGVVEKMVTSDKFYTATVKVNDKYSNELTFTADDKENEKYMKSFMYAWEKVLNRCTLARNQDDGLIHLVEMSETDNGNIRFRKKDGTIVTRWTLDDFLGDLDDDVASSTGWHPWLETTLETVKKAYLEDVISYDGHRDVIFLDGCHNGKLTSGHVVARLLLRKEPLL